MTRGTVYLIHFSTKYISSNGKGQVGHYLGYTRKGVSERLKEHRQGRGATLTRVVCEAGIELELVRCWHGDRSLERRLKNRRNHKVLCPICNPERAQYNAQLYSFLSNQNN